MKFRIGYHTLELPAWATPRAPEAPRKQPRHQRLSPAPWWGFSKHDQPRQQPLPACPNARCARAQKCLAAIEGLYCLRTHHDRFEQQWLRRHHPLAREIALIPKVKDRKDFRAIARRAEKINELRRAFEQAMLARWKAGSLDHLYGKYAPKGALLAPPKRQFKG